MVQNTLEIQNQAANPARLDIEQAIQAVATNSSDATASPTASTPPTTTYPNMWWYDTFTHLLNIRNEADTAWINVAYLNQGGTFEVLDDTKVVNTSGTQTGLLGDQITSTWQTGTGTTESLVSPAKIKASVIANSLQQTNLTTNVSGYFTMSNGLIYQWDTWAYSHGTRNFPVAFPNKCLGFGYTQTSGWYENWNASVSSASQYSTSNVMVGTNSTRAYNQYMFSIGH